MPRRTAQRTIEMPWSPLHTGNLDGVGSKSGHLSKFARTGPLKNLVFSAKYGKQNPEDALGLIVDTTLTTTHGYKMRTDYKTYKNMGGEHTYNEKSKLVRAFSIQERKSGGAERDGILDGTGVEEWADMRDYDEVEFYTKTSELTAIYSMKFKSVEQMEAWMASDDEPDNIEEDITHISQAMSEEWADKMHMDEVEEPATALPPSLKGPLFQLHFKQVRTWLTWLEEGGEMSPDNKSYMLKLVDDAGYIYNAEGWLEVLGGTEGGLKNSEGFVVKKMHKDKVPWQILERAFADFTASACHDNLVDEGVIIFKEFMEGGVKKMSEDEWRMMMRNMLGCLFTEEKYREFGKQVFTMVKKREYEEEDQTTSLYLFFKDYEWDVLGDKE